MLGKVDVTWFDDYNELVVLSKNVAHDVEPGKFRFGFYTGLDCTFRDDFSFWGFTFQYEAPEWFRVMFCKLLEYADSAELVWKLYIQDEKYIYVLMEE